MLLFSLKSLKFRLTAVLLSLVAVLSIVLIFSVDKLCSPGTNAVSAGVKEGAKDRIGFLLSFGWQVENDPIDVSDVYIPDEFGETYLQYNDIQKLQGFDLADYKGKCVKRWVYMVTNYPGYIDSECIHATILIYNGQIIGGDICSVEMDGFMHGFKKEQ